MHHKNRIAALVLTGLVMLALTAQSLLPAFGGEQTEEIAGSAGAQTEEENVSDSADTYAQTEQEAVSDSAGAYAQTESEAEHAQSSSFLDMINPDLLPKLDPSIVEAAKQKILEIDPEVLKEDLKLIRALLMSEDFQSLIQYEQVQELTVMLINNTLDFVHREPALTRKILKKLGVDANVVYIIIYALNYSQELLDQVKDSPDSVSSVIEIIQFLSESSNNEEFVNLLLSIAMLTGNSELTSLLAEAGYSLPEFEEETEEELTDYIGAEDFPLF